MMQQCCHLHQLARSMPGDAAGLELVPTAAAVQATEAEVGVLDACNCLDTVFIC
jgi:hypothetical protein